MSANIKINITDNGTNTIQFFGYYYNNFSSTATNLAIKIMQNCHKLNLVSDHYPESVALAALQIMIRYYNLDFDTSKYIKLCNVSNIVVKKIYCKISPYIDALVDDDITNHLVKEFITHPKN